MKKVRYAVIGAGWISQEAFLPAVAQTGNAEVVALVSGSPEKARRLADFHRIPQLVLQQHRDYAVYLRHYTQGWSETVMFFVPRTGGA